MSPIRGQNCKYPCPVCIMPLEKLHDLSKTFVLRSMQDAIDALNTYKISKGQGEALLKVLGLRAVVVSYSLSYSLVSPLHNYVLLFYWFALLISISFIFHYSLLHLVWPTSPLWHLLSTLLILLIPCRAWHGQPALWHLSSTLLILLIPRCAWHGQLALCGISHLLF
jgi:hypothetical protein